jgi:antitoxin component of MazEF toxin-antitoxin module
MATLLKRETQGRLTKQGNSTSLNLPREVLQAACLNRGDSVTITTDLTTRTITVRKADDDYSRTMAAGRAVAARYRRTLAALAK